VTVDTRHAVSDDGHAAGVHSDPTTEHDYFTDPVPLRGDREVRERDERLRRLERARPHRRGQRPRLRIGVVVLGAGVLGAGALSLLGHSTDRKAIDAHSSSGQASQHPAAEPLARPPEIGLAQAVARPKPGRHEPVSRRPPHQAHRKASRVENGDTAAPTAPVAEPEPTGSEATAEPETEPETVVTPVAEAEPEPPPEAPEPEASAPPASTKEDGGTSSSSEANRQFGFGR